MATFVEQYDRTEKIFDRRPVAGFLAPPSTTLCPLAKAVGEETRVLYDDRGT